MRLRPFLLLAALLPPACAGPTPFPPTERATPVSVESIPTTTTTRPPTTISVPPSSSTTLMPRPRATRATPPALPVRRPGPRLADPLTCGQAAALVAQVSSPSWTGCGPMLDPAHDKAETAWWPDGRVTVTFRVDRCCTRLDALHEASHVRVGYAADHGPAWAAELARLEAAYTVG